MNMSALCSNLQSLVSWKLVWSVSTVVPNQTEALRFFACLLKVSILGNLAVTPGILSLSPKRGSMCGLVLPLQWTPREAEPAPAAHFPIAEHMSTAGRHGKLDAPCSHTWCQIGGNSSSGKYQLLTLNKHPRLLNINMVRACLPERDVWY